MMHQRGPARTPLDLTSPSTLCPQDARMSQPASLQRDADARRYDSEQLRLRPFYSFGPARSLEQPQTYNRSASVDTHMLLGLVVF